MAEAPVRRSGTPNCEEVNQLAEGRLLRESMFSHLNNHNGKPFN